MEKRTENRKQKIESKGKKLKKKNKITIDRKKYEELKQELEELREQKEKFVRSMADYENARKRLKKEKEEFVKFANEELVISLLPIIDDFERAIESVDKGHDIENVIQGVKMIKNQFVNVLKSEGLEKIKAKKEKFNPNIHEAIDFVETDEYEEDTVIEVLQPGYTFKQRLLRPAVVRVAKSTKEEGRETKEEGREAKNKEVK